MIESRLISRKERGRSPASIHRQAHREKGREDCRLNGASSRLAKRSVGKPTSSFSTPKNKMLLRAYRLSQTNGCEEYNGTKNDSISISHEHSLAYTWHGVVLAPTPSVLSHAKKFGYPNPPISFELEFPIFVSICETQSTVSLLFKCVCVCSNGRHTHTRQKTLFRMCCSVKENGGEKKKSVFKRGKGRSITLPYSPLLPYAMLTSLSSFR